MIEYKPREPRNKIIFPNAARPCSASSRSGWTIWASCSTSAIPCTAGDPGRRRAAVHRRGPLFAIDVNDNFRGWDDDMVVGSVHLVETFEFFYTLRKNNWDGVWQLDQFPFREDSVAAAKVAIRFLKALHGALWTRWTRRRCALRRPLMTRSGASGSSRMSC